MVTDAYCLATRKQFSAMSVIYKTALYQCNLTSYIQVFGISQLEKKIKLGSDIQAAAKIAYDKGYVATGNN